MARGSFEVLEAPIGHGDARDQVRGEAPRIRRFLKRAHLRWEPIQPEVGERRAAAQRALDHGEVEGVAVGHDEPTSASSERSSTSASGRRGRRARRVRSAAGAGRGRISCSSRPSISVHVGLQPGREAAQGLGHVARAEDEDARRRDQGKHSKKKA
jgi:hypothetical protein